MMSGMAPGNVRVNANELKDRQCTHCGGLVFSHALSLKEVPPLRSPSGRAETAMTPIGFVCVTCGEFMTLRPEDPSIVIPKRDEVPKGLLG